MIPRTVLIILAMVVPALAADEKSNVLKLPNGAQLTAPEGFAWQKIGEEGEEGKKYEMFVANKEGSGNIIFVGFMPGKTEGDAARIAGVKNFHKGIVDSFAKKPNAQVKTTLADLKPPIPQRVQFMIFSKTDERSLYICGILFFGKSTYQFSASGSTAEEALQLAKATESLKE